MLHTCGGTKAKRFKLTIKINAATIRNTIGAFSSHNRTSFGGGFV